MTTFIALTLLILFCALLGYAFIGFIFALVLDRDSVLDWGKYPLLGLFYMVFYPAKWLIYTPMKWAYSEYKERNHIPTPTEVAAGMITQLALKHPERWNGAHFNHKNVEIWRTRLDKCGHDWTWSAKIGNEAIPLSKKNMRLIDTSVQIRAELDRNKAKADKEHRVLNEIEVLLK